MEESKSVETKIADLRAEIMASSDSNENGRIKAMINTHLQLAELLASKLYDERA